jgi:hypothetical protein
VARLKKVHGGYDGWVVDDDHDHNTDDNENAADGNGAIARAENASAKGPPAPSISTREATGGSWSVAQGVAESNLKTLAARQQEQEQEQKEHEGGGGGGAQQRRRRQKQGEQLAMLRGDGATVDGGAMAASLAGDMFRGGARGSASGEMARLDARLLVDCKVTPIPNP